jgi:hypothetical protein
VSRRYAADCLRLHVCGESAGAMSTFLLPCWFANSVQPFPILLLVKLFTVLIVAQFVWTVTNEPSLVFKNELETSGKAVYDSFENELLAFHVEWDDDSVEVTFTQHPNNPMDFLAGMTPDWFALFSKLWEGTFGRPDLVTEKGQAHQPVTRFPGTSPYHF